MKTSFLWLMIFFVVILFGVESVNGCMCGSLSPCLMNARADSVFVGKIKDVNRKGNSAVHDVEIEKHFGGLENKNSVEIYTDQVTSCAFSMEKGETYLIFARIGEESGFVRTGYCSGTKKLKDSIKEIEYLESLKNAEDGKGILSGSILEYDLKNKFDVKPWKPKEVDKIYIEFENGEKFEKNIAEDGNYSIENLKGGWYRVSILIPERLIASEELNDEYIYKEGFRKIERKVKVPGSGCETENHYSVRVNGIITGKVLDATGTPLKKIPVTLYRFDDADDMPEENYKVWSDDEGVYVAKGLPSGRYMIGFGIDNSLYINSRFAGYLPTYFPNKSKRKETPILNLGNADKLIEKDIRLFPKLGMRKITGQVIYENGKPASDTDLVFYARRKVASDRLEGGYELKLDANGNFEMDAYEETEYFILGRKFDSQEWKTRKIVFSSNCYELPKNGNILPLKIIMKSGSKNCDVTKLENK